MGDLLIRNISDAMKADLAGIADRDGQSLSEAAKSALRHGIGVIKKVQVSQDALPMGQRLQQIFAGVFETNEEAEEFQRILEEVRHGPERPLPDFK